MDWAVLVATHHDDEAALERFRRWSVIVQGPSGNSSGVVRTTPKAEPGRSVVDDTSFYGQYTYRRAIPQDRILPGMVRLVRD